MSWPLSAEDERENYLLTMQQCILASLPQLVLDLWDESSVELWKYGYWTEYLKGVNISLQAARQIGDTGREGRLLYEAGWAHMEKGGYTSAEWCFDQSRNITEDLYLKGLLWNSLMSLAAREERFEQATDYFHKGIAFIHTQKGGTPPKLKSQWDAQEAVLYNLMGIMLLRQKNFESAHTFLDQAIAIYASLNIEYHARQSAPLLHKANAYLEKDEYTLAQKYFSQCLEFSQGYGRKDTTVYALFGLAKVAAAVGRPEEALSLANQAVLLTGDEMIKFRTEIAIFKREARLT